MTDFKTIYKGTCLFCGKQAKEHFYSGSYETYLSCDCHGVQKYIAMREQLRHHVAVAEARKDALIATERRKEAEQTLLRSKHAETATETALFNAIERTK
jgi:hypothetical protein